MAWNDDSQIYGRYALYGEIAAGGMATVHYGRLLGQSGFSRPVAIKRLLPDLKADPDFVKMFLEEARLAARVRHPNVVPALDVVSLNEEILLVMDYVHGETLSRLVRVCKRMGEHIPPRIVVGIICGALEGLHAAHEAKSEKGLPLGLVHRDVSPQNIMVGKDGVTRVLDFGVAKATAKRTETRGDLIKGKASYMAPEQLVGGAVDQRADIFGASVCMWQALTGEKLFQGESFEAIAQAVVTEPIRPAGMIVPNIPRSLDEVLMKGLDRDAQHRWPTAREMAIQLERALAPASLREIGAWVERIAGDRIEARARVVAQIERVSLASISVGDMAPESKREESKIPDLVATAGAEVSVYPPVPAPTLPNGRPVISQSAQPATAREIPLPAKPPPVATAQPAAAAAVAAPVDNTPFGVATPREKKRGGGNVTLIAVGVTVIVAVGLGFGLYTMQQRAVARAALENAQPAPPDSALEIHPTPSAIAPALSAKPKK